MDGVMPITTLLLEARATGLMIVSEGDRLTVRGPRSAEDLARRILSRKAEVIEALRQGELGHATEEIPSCIWGQPAKVVWQHTVEEVAAAWGARATRDRAAGLEPPWLDEALDAELQGSVGEALRGGDEVFALEAIEEWRAAWFRLLAPEDAQARLSARCRATQLPANVLFELAAGDVDPTAAEMYARAIHLRAVALVEESEGRRPPSNPTVHAMFDEARDRLGSRYLQERSITSWLRRNAPEIAVAWVDAPPDASWLDWRCRTGREAVPQLDAAWKAVCLGAGGIQDNPQPEASPWNDSGHETVRRPCVPGAAKDNLRDRTAMNVVELSPQQERAVEKVQAWLSEHRGPQWLTLGGLAGTGKTTVVNELVRRLSPVRIAVCALTGKAVSVLRRKGVSNAQTIHSVMYIRNGEDAAGRPIFVKAESIDDDVIIVDEASMVSRELHLDLASYGRKILYVGDHGQLEPVGEDAGLMKNLTIRLEEIHRQARDSGIIRFAHALRTGKSPAEAEGDDDVAILSPKAFWGLAGEVDVLLCAYNRTRHRANQRSRERLGFSGPLPQVGERVICLRNEHRLGLYNGLVLKVVGIAGERESILELDLEDDQGQVLRRIPALKVQFGQDSLAMKVDRGIGLFDFGYCLTVHKAQGSEWDTVAVLEQPCDHWSMPRWRYTAATRAVKRLYYCCDGARLISGPVREQMATSEESVEQNPAPASEDSNVQSINSKTVLGPEPTPRPGMDTNVGVSVQEGDAVNIGKFLSAYLRAKDITHPRVITIERVAPETLGRDGEEEEKLVLHYRGESRGVVLSKPMLHQLVSILESNETNDWIGKQVEIFRDDDVWLEGKQVSGIRFRMCSEPKPLEKEIGETPFG